MRSLKLICLASLLAASPLAGAQTLDDANRFYEKGQYESARVALEKLTALATEQVSGVRAARIRAVQYTKAYQ